MKQKIVYIDTAGLWSLDALLFPQKYNEPRWKEYFAYFCDLICDPTRDIYCAMPDNARLGAPLPTFYNSLIANNLLKDFDPLGAKVLATPIEELQNQFEEFDRHITVYHKYLKKWFDLHNHEDIRDGWKIGVPNQSKLWEGVPKNIEEFINEFHLSKFLSYEKKYKFPISHSTLLFSFIQRGHSYSLRAGLNNAEYFTHPVRWQVARSYEIIKPDKYFGIAIGGLILGLIDCNELKRNPDAICEYLANIRTNINSEAFINITTLEEAKDIIIHLVPSFAGAKLNPRLAVYLNATISTILTIANSWSEGFTKDISTAYWLVAMVAAAGVTFKIPGKHVELFRKSIDYPKILNLDLQTCHKDGGIKNLEGVCPSCELRKLAYKNRR